MRIMHYGRILANNKWNVKKYSRLQQGLHRHGNPRLSPGASAPTWDLVRVPGELGVRGGTAKAVPCAVHLDHSQSSPFRYAYAPRGRQGAAAPVQVVIFDALRVLQTGPSVNSL